MFWKTSADVLVVAADPGAGPARAGRAGGGVEHRRIGLEHLPGRGVDVVRRAGAQDVVVVARAEPLDVLADGIGDFVGGILPDIDLPLVFLLFRQQAAAEVAIDHLDLL